MVIAMIQIVDSVEQLLSLLHQFVGLITIDPLALKLSASQKDDHLPGKRVPLAGDVGDRGLQAGIGSVITGKEGSHTFPLAHARGNTWSDSSPHFLFEVCLGSRIVGSTPVFMRLYARYYWLLLAEGHLNRRRFAAMLGRLALLPVPAG